MFKIFNNQKAQTVTDQTMSNSGAGPGHPMLCPALILSCWTMREVLGVLGCTWVTEVGDYSTNGFEASQYFTNQHGCTHANRLTINCWHGGCFSQGSLWRITAVRADSVTLQHCLACTVGTEPSPPFWAWAEGSASRSWTISKALRTACSSPPRSPQGWLAAVSRLPGAS